MYNSLRKSGSPYHETGTTYCKTKAYKKYNSYKGEITPAVENIVSRDFHAEKPN